MIESTPQRVEREILERQIADLLNQPKPSICGLCGATYCLDQQHLECPHYQKSGDKIVTTHDSVNHPKHYTSHPSGVECIDVVRHMNFNLGNVIKYIWRAGLKVEDLVSTDNHLRDLKKARWYLDDEIKRLEKLNGQ